MELDMIGRTNILLFMGSVGKLNRLKEGDTF